jgi:hypothetical protein
MADLEAVVSGAIRDPNSEPQDERHRHYVDEQ